MSAQFKITLPAELEYLEEFQTAVSHFAQEQGFTPKRISEIELALEEALVNIFHYAYQETRKDVEVVCQGDSPDRLIIEIIDRGISFNPLLKDDPDLTLDMSERKIGGLGVYLIKTLMDEVGYRREGDHNILTLVVYKNKNT